MLLGKRCLQELNCGGLSSCRQYTYQLPSLCAPLCRRPAVAAASDRTGPGPCSSSRNSASTTTCSDGNSSNGTSYPAAGPPAVAAGTDNSSKQQQQQQQQQQHTSVQQALQHSAAWPLQQRAHRQRSNRQPEQQQLQPQPAVQVLPMQQFEVVSEKAVHQRYLTVYDRRIKFSAHDNPAECRELAFDVVGHPRANFRFAVTFPFHPYTDGRKGGEVTLIREYAQGPNALAYCLPTGGLDPQRHADLQDCAARELSEEAYLAGGAWQRLLPAGHPGLAEVKWCMNRFMPFLVVDPQPDPNPGRRDVEEASMEVLRVPLDEFKLLMVSGEMLLPSITTAYMAMDRLREQGLL